MEQNTDCIIKNGIVVSVSPEKVNVKIHNQSACSMCYSKGVCTSLGSGERIVEVENRDYELQPGDIVNVKMVSSSGMKAVILAYVIPFVLLIVTLVVTVPFLGEGFAALLSLSVLAPYYLGLYFFRQKMKRYFHFTITSESE